MQSFVIRPSPFSVYTGEWSSPAFLKYMDWLRLEADLVVHAHLAESEDEVLSYAAMSAHL